MERHVKHRNRLPREMVESPCLEGSRKRVDVAFGMWVSGEQDSAGGTAGLDDFKGPF